MYEFSNPKLALKLIDEIIISGRFPNYVNLDSDEYDEDEVDMMLTEILQSPIISVRVLNDFSSPFLLNELHFS